MDATSMRWLGDLGPDQLVRIVLAMSERAMVLAFRLEEAEGPSGCARCESLRAAREAAYDLAFYPFRAGGSPCGSSSPPSLCG